MCNMHVQPGFQGSGGLALLRGWLRSRRQKPAPAEPGAVSPENFDYYYPTWFNTPYNRRWHVFATQTRESESRRVPCSTCAVLVHFAVFES